MKISVPSLGQKGGNKLTPKAETKKNE